MEYNTSGLNHELCTGTITHTNPTLTIDRAHPNPRGSHLSIGSNEAVKVTIINSTFDAGYQSAPTKFFVRVMNS